MAPAVGETEEPAEFRRAVEQLRTAALRPEIELEDMPRPRNLAPFSAAFSAEVVVDDEELGGGGGGGGARKPPPPAGGGAVR
ncbi:DUF3000 family protein, partial [Streptodolium elevatio]